MNIIWPLKTIKSNYNSVNVNKIDPHLPFGEQRRRY